MFEAIPYSIENLITCLAKGSSFSSEDRIRNKRQKVYFEEYFRELQARTIVVENPYIDKDYLEDYAAYYDRCFKDYPRQATRLHFFSHEFTAEQFEQLLVSDDEAVLTEQTLKDAYLGFVVVKPLPETIVGRTCLKTYPSDEGRRQFPILRTYPVNLYGLDLSIESLAYQEQDTVVAACATSSLWSCFQGTGKLFQHMIPPPVEITNWAGDHLPENLMTASARAFPNNGLTGTQMAHAIKKVGLEPFVIGSESRYGMNSVVYAYLRGKIPFILCCALINSDGSKNLTNQLGGHAIAITGFSLEDGEPVSEVNTGFQLRASKVDKIYGHDDQVGPFARMVWDKVRSSGVEIDALLTSWSGSIYAVPHFLLLPLYHKIRIPYSVIHDAILHLDSILEQIRAAQLPGVPRAEWDIYLTTSSEYKSTIRSDYSGLELDLAGSLYAHLPKYVWRVSLRQAGKLEIDLLFDATGIANHSLLVHAVSAGSIYAQLIGVLQTVDVQLPTQARAIVEKFSVTLI
nr:hypothetical protein [uncultured Pseudomonas sp.]